MANYLHQPVMSIGAGLYTFSSHLTCIRGSGGEALGDFGGNYYQNNPFLGMF